MVSSIGNHINVLSKEVENLAQNQTSKSERKQVSTREGKSIADMHWKQGMTIHAIMKKTGRARGTIKRYIFKHSPSTFGGILLNEDETVSKHGVIVKQGVLALDGSAALIASGAVEAVNQPDGPADPFPAMIDAATGLSHAMAELKSMQRTFDIAKKKYEEAKAEFENTM